MEAAPIASGCRDENALPAIAGWGTGAERGPSCDDNPVPRSPVSVIRENVVSCLHDRVAREPALGVVPLRRMVRQGAGRERIGCSVIVEHGPSPPAAVREPVAVLLHEVNIMLGAWHRRCGERLHLF